MKVDFVNLQDTISATNFKIKTPRSVVGIDNIPNVQVWISIKVTVIKVFKK